MVDFDLDTTEVLAMARRYEGGPRIAQSELLDAMGGAVQDTKANVITVITPFSRTGKLADSNVTSVRQSGQSVTGTVRNTAPHARWVDGGRGPVFPRARKVLRWVSRSGEVVFAQMARAFPGHHFMRKGLERSRQQIFRRFERAAERIAARLVGGR